MRDPISSEVLLLHAVRKRIAEDSWNGFFVFYGLCVIPDAHVVSVRALKGTQGTKHNSDLVMILPDAAWFRQNDAESGRQETTERALLRIYEH